MALFDFLKPKSHKWFDNAPDVEAAMKKIHEKIFPNGEVDIARDVSRVAQITNGKIRASEMRSFVLGCKSLLFLKGENADESIVGSFKVRSGNLINNAEALDVYAYLDGEAHYIDTFSAYLRTTGTLSPEKLTQLQHEAFEKASHGSCSDTINKGYGEFGLVVTNPIPTISIRCSRQYLAKLRYAGKALDSKRLGSLTSDVTAGNIDIYQLGIDGKLVAQVYICPYHKRNSRLAPLGFTLDGVR